MLKSRESLKAPFSDTSHFDLYIVSCFLICEFVKAWLLLVWDHLPRKKNKERWDYCCANCCQNQKIGGKGPNQLYLLFAVIITGELTNSPWHLYRKYFVVSLDIDDFLFIRMRRNVNWNVFNNRKNVSATTQRQALTGESIIKCGASTTQAPGTWRDGSCT